MNQHLPLAVPPQRVPLTIAAVELLNESGAFDNYGKVELIEGELLYVNAQYRRHMVAKSELAYRIRRVLEAAGSGLFVGIEGSVALSQHDLPQPDIILTSSARGAGAVPGDSVALLIEVADVTLKFDMNIKSRVYAGAMVPEYWIVDVNGGEIHQMWAPTGSAYSHRRVIAFGEQLTAQTIAGLAIDTTGI